MDDKDVYTFYYQDDLKMDFVTERPPYTDQAIQFCVAGAFTDLNDGEIDGLYMNNGQLKHEDRINKTLGGLFILRDGEFELIETQKTKLITDSLLNALKAEKADLFQQIFMIVDGKVEPLKQKRMFQRRAIVIMNDDSRAIVENVKRKTLATFCNDLVSLDVKEALYVDMGGWDEGWFRDASGSANTIGRMRGSTDQQSNWVIFRTARK